MWEKGRFGKVFGLAWTRETVCACAQRPLLECFREVWAAWLFLPDQEGGRWLSQTKCRASPFVSAETLKACALIGLHLLSPGGEGGSGGSQSPDLGAVRRHGCPLSPEWLSSCSVSETSFGCEEYEHNNECRAIEVIGRFGHARWWRSFSSGSSRE